MFIFGWALTLKRGFSEFLEAQFCTLFIEHLGPICLLHVVKLNVTWLQKLEMIEFFGFCKSILFSYGKIGKECLP